VRSYYGGKGTSARSRCSAGYILPVNGKSVIKMFSLRKLHAAMARTVVNFLSDIYLLTYDWSKD